MIPNGQDAGQYGIESIVLFANACQIKSKSRLVDVSNSGSDSLGTPRDTGPWLFEKPQRAN